MILSPSHVAPGARCARAMLFMLATGLAGFADAQVYSWTDPVTGRKVVSDVPPPAGIKAEQVRKASGETPSPGDETGKTAVSGGSDKPAGSSEKKPENDKNALLCSSTKENIAQLESDRPVATPDGRPLDAEGRAAELARSRDILRLFCSKR